MYEKELMRVMCFNIVFEDLLNYCFNQETLNIILSVTNLSKRKSSNEELLYLTNAFRVVNDCNVKLSYLKIYQIYFQL